MAETLTIRTAASTEVIKIAVQGPQGPAGAPGTGLETLTIKGDTLYRGDTTGERLPIGTSGQVLKVSSSGIPEWGEAPSGVSSWNDLTDKPASFTPSAHSSTHHTGGTDALAAHQINGQTIFGTASATYSTDQTLTANRARQFTISNTNAGGINVTLPTGADGTLVGDTYVVIGGSTVSGPIVVRRINVLSPLIYETLATITATGQQYRFRAAGGTTGGWSLVPVDSHTQAASTITGLATVATTGDYDDLSDKPTLGGAAALNVGTTTGTVAAGDDARLSDSRDPTAHAASHAAAGSDPLELANLAATGTGDGDLLVADGGGAVAWVAGQTWAAQNITSQDIGAASSDHTHGNITNDGKVGSTAGLPLKTGTAGVVEAGAFGVGAGEFAEGNHTHELANLDATGATDGHVLTADGAGGAAWEAASGGGSSIMQAIAVGFVLN